MKELIEVFKMQEVSVPTRIRLIIKLGNAINHNYGANVTEPIVYELVKLLDPANTDVETDQYTRFNP